jgi:hypothetical protein
MEDAIGKPVLEKEGLNMKLSELFTWKEFLTIQHSLAKLLVRDAKTKRQTTRSF